MNHSWYYLFGGSILATLPSTYWYMQGFDVVGLETYLYWFNLMTYEIHVVQPHNNLTEITEGLDLLWWKDVSPSKVTLGEALAALSRFLTLM
ncbi:hypothetical protein N7454_011144 [Penicillium verhagenii]|nr:hypothetical protein N7454_011144 [Penicillium verhagenii]